jgi:septal ring factor EnvC (AmiA/AmiB activator)
MNAMSKAINMLSEAEKEKNSKSSIQIAEIQQKADKDKPAEPPKIKKGFLIGVLLFLILAVTVAINLKLFFLIKNMSSEKNITLEQITKLNGLLKENNQQVSTLSDSIKKMEADIDYVKTGIKEAKENVVKIQEATNAQNANLENLTKAKNTLFTTITELKAKIGDTKVSPTSNN